MAEEKKAGRGMMAPIIAVDEQPVGMFSTKEQKRALKDLNQLHDDARGLLAVAMPALQGIQAAVKAKEPSLNINQALELARHITSDTQAFKTRLDQIKAKIPTAPSDQAVLSSLHIATELQQWTEDWSNVAEPMITSVNSLLEKKDV